MSLILIINYINWFGKSYAGRVDHGRSDCFIVVVWVLTLWFDLLFIGCTDTDLTPIAEKRPFRDDKFAASGSYCTTPPESKLLPLRVLFVVDASESMRVTDPGDPVTEETGRERAIGEAFRKILLEEPQGVQIGIIRFSAEAHSQTAQDYAPTDGIPDSFFTSDTVELEAGTLALRETDRTTNYLVALSEAYYELRTEMALADLESRPLSKYVVVFISDGLPDTDSNEALLNTEQNILDSVGELKDLADRFRIGTFEFHTAYISSGEGPARDKKAQELLQNMAKVGNGDFRSFPSGEQLSFEQVDFTVVRRVFTLKDLTVVNQNVVMDRDQVREYIFPSEADAGIADAAQIVISEGDEFSNDASLGNLVFNDASEPDVSEQNPGQAFLRHFVDIDGDGVPTCGEPLVDTDSDGLADFVEERLGTNLLLKDSDDDGLNDRLELPRLDKNEISRELEELLSSSDLNPLVSNQEDCLLPQPCVLGPDEFCECILDTNMDGMCDCTEDPDKPCLDDLGHDCLDEGPDGEPDGMCDCPDLDQDGFCDYSDRDKDGLNDCEELFHGTAQNGNDTDADGLPDWLEVHSQSNPVESDRLEDIDWDKTKNGIEVRSGNDPWCDDAKNRSVISYRYDIRQRERKEHKKPLDGVTCYDFDVGNITLVPTILNRDSVYPGNGWNRIFFYAGEVSVDDPDAYPSYRVACVMVRYEPDGNYKNPPSGRVSLQEKDFIDVGEFNETEHCIWP